MIVDLLEISLTFCDKNKSRRQNSTVLQNANLNLVSNLTFGWRLKSEISDGAAVNGLMDKNEIEKKIRNSATIQRDVTFTRCADFIGFRNSQHFQFVRLHNLF